MFHSWHRSVSAIILRLRKVKFLNKVSRNPPGVRVTSGEKPRTKFFYIVSQTSVRLWYISSQKQSFLATPNVENKCWTSSETLGSTGEMKLMIKHCLYLNNQYLNLKFIVSSSHGKCFRSYFRLIFFYHRYRDFLTKKRLRKNGT